jgi:hypothetical protein
MNNHGAVTIVARQCRAAPLNGSEGSTCHLEVDLYGVDLHDFARRLTDTQRTVLLGAPAIDAMLQRSLAATGSPPVDLSPLTGKKP